ncbi:Riboflavin transporter RfnT [Pandoraea terrae]|uniref:Riboflavin transporter RfnT n=2 Tax=Pandoraea terrae TaxID=1537710 RepID=A0A5E4T8Z7_9BURK|nr:MFS transporter [Pandoraea terrae]VVD82539.1 Riboflavin transporter RfnT [Pandoraea terrae]
MPEAVTETAVAAPTLAAADPAAGRQGRRYAAILAACQALYTAAMSVDLTLTGLVGFVLAADKGNATLPFSLITVASAVTTIFASLLIQRLGQRIGFAIGAAAGTLGGLISVWAIFEKHFALFCVGTACVGVFQAFARYYRLAAADVVPLEDKPRAISIVLTGGVIAAVLGPALAAGSKDWLAPVTFAGSYLVVALLSGVSLLLLLGFLRNLPVHAAMAPGVAGTAGVSAGAGQAPARPLGEIMRQPIYIASLANNLIGFMVMMFVMTATPIGAVACGHSIGDGARIIEWHLVGMYAPSFFSGHLVKRWGVVPVLLAGIAMCAACGVLALMSTSLPYFYAALLCLGVGWNFMFVGGTTLLTMSYRPAERGRAQAANEFITFAGTAASSLFAGQLLARFGWAMINQAIFPLLAVAAVTTVWYAFDARRRTPDVASA